MKKRAIRNTKHRIAKALRLVRRKGDDWAEVSNKQYIEADRSVAKRHIKNEVTALTTNLIQETE